MFYRELVSRIRIVVAGQYELKVDVEDDVELVGENLWNTSGLLWKETYAVSGGRCFEMQQPEAWNKKHYIQSLKMDLKVPKPYIFYNQCHTCRLVELIRSR